VNDSLRFVCDYVHLRAGTDRTPFTRGIPEGSILKMPVAHYQGNYYADERTCPLSRSGAGSSSATATRMGT